MAVVLQVDMNGAPIAELAAHAAALKIAGVGAVEICKQIREETGWPIKRTYLEKRLEKHPVFVEIFEKAQKNLIKKTLLDIKKFLGLRGEKICKAIDKGIEDGDSKYVVIALKLLGAEDLDPDKKPQEGNLTVILPGVRPADIVIPKKED